MADMRNIVIRHMNGFASILTTHNQAAAQAAAITLEVNAFGGGSAIADDADIDWSTMPITKAEYIAALSTCDAYPGVLGGHATNLHKAKS
jgi:hypothetical protein